ncbi:MAG: sugar ABC transporter permease [Bacillota bacterium]|jgi:multiple sugar transport system permease protein|nr:sugar ABC transporter permease [Bacillota bacterium]HOB42972.1 sugar ABC transporter permease [Bacillota bacterium]HOK70764.1 sugar ABC transporter permease [Bacillota bacterium]HOL52271.1 sugar ABC transporter permease [Bacillota bacterium]HOO31032.1 sugar ABC transporter permease [Bacillota bacterium]
MGQTRGRTLFFIPALALLALFVVYPVANTIWLSFFTPEGEFAFFKNYADVLSQPEIFDPRGFERGFPYGALIHNVIWIVLHLPLTVILGLVFAVILRDIKGGAIVKSIVFLGMVTPMVVGGIILRFLFDGNVGIIPSVLALFGFAPRTLTAYPDTALFSLIAGSLWLWTPFSMVLYSAGLETIPDFVYEAAVIDGASPWRIFFNITVPLLKPVTGVVVTMTFLWVLKIFDIVFVATMGGPGGASNVLALQMYMYAFREFNPNAAAVVATFLMIVALVVSIPTFKAAGGEE